MSEQQYIKEVMNELRLKEEMAEKVHEAFMRGWKQGVEDAKKIYQPVKEEA